MTTLNITIPAIGTAFSTAAANVNDALTAIKAAIEGGWDTSDLEIDADLEMNGFSLLETGSVQLAAQDATLATTATGRIYLYAEDLYFNDGAGNVIQLTVDGALNIAAAGGIGGAYGTDGSIVTYTAGVSDWYDFLATSTTYATLRAAQITLFGTGASPSTSITIDVPAGITPYSLTLPATMPTIATTVMTMSTTGNVTNTSTPNLVSAQLSGTLSAAVVTATGAVRGSQLNHTANEVIQFGAGDAVSDSTDWNLVTSTTNGSHWSAPATVAGAVLIFPLSIPSGRTLADASVYMTPGSGTGVSISVHRQSRATAGAASAVVGTVTTLGAGDAGVYSGYDIDTVTGGASELMDNTYRYWIQVTGSTTGDLVYGARIRYTRPS